MSYILDIEEKKEGISYSILRKTLRGVSIEKQGTINSSLKGGDADIINGELTSLREKYKIGEARVFLPFRYFLSHVLDLPLKKKRDIESALPFELEENLPMPLEEYLYDYKVIERSDESTKILTLCIGRKYITGLIAQFAGAGLEVSSVRCGLMARLSSAYSMKGRKSFLLLDSDQDDVSMVVIKDGRFMLARHLANSGTLDSDIAVIREKYVIDNIFLTGSPSDAVRNATGKPGESTVVPEIRKSRKGFFDLEVYSARTRDWTIGERKQLVVLILILTALMGVSGFFWPVYKDYDALRKVNSQIAQIKEEASDLFKKREGLEEKREKLRFIEEIKSTQDMPLVVLSELSSLLPENVWLIGFSIDEKGFIELKGFAEDAAKLVEMLEKSEMFRNVGFSSPLLTSGDKVRFSVRMEIER